MANLTGCNFSDPYNYSECFSSDINLRHDICNSTSDGLDIPEYFSYRYRTVGTFFQGIVFTIGILGNLMVVVVVRRTRSMHSPTNCYLVSLAVADMIVLVASVPNEILSYYTVGNRWHWGDIGCSGFVFFQNLGINASSLSLIAFTLERYIAICHPMRAHKSCTLRRAKRITAAVWVSAITYCSPWFALTVTKPLNYRGYPGARFCDFKLPRNQYLAYFFADLVLFYVIPLVVSCVLYTLIARTLTFRKMIRGGDKKNGAVEMESTAISSRSQVVKILAVVVAVFATLWLPYRGMLVYNSFAILFQRPRFMDLWFLMFAKTCVFINSAINPILYNAMSTKFRRAFQKLLSCYTPVPRTISTVPMASFKTSSTSTTTSRKQSPCKKSSRSNTTSF